jgi:2-hydroxy-3-oxopropionate reductase
MEKEIMSSVAFIGLGVMGAPMARNLLNAGFDVVGHNRSPEKARAFADAGGRTARTVAEAVREATVVATMLPDTPDVLGVMHGPGGVFACAESGALIIDFSTIRPAAAAELAAEASALDFRMIDAPVSGGESGATEATLSIMVGGAEEDFEIARPLLEALGKTIVRVGNPGAGQLVKAANQLIVGGTIELVAEAIVLLEAHGVEPVAALDAIGGGLAGSAVLSRKGPGMISRQFTPGFRLSLHRKDMGIVTDSAREAGVVIPLGALVSQLIIASVAGGDGDLDHSALLRLVEQLSGRAD